MVHKPEAAPKQEAVCACVSFFFLAYVGLDCNDRDIECGTDEERTFFQQIRSM